LARAFELGEVWCSKRKMRRRIRLHRATLWIQSCPGSRTRGSENAASIRREQRPCESVMVCRYEEGCQERDRCYHTTAARPWAIKETPRSFAALAIISHYIAGRLTEHNLARTRWVLPQRDLATTAAGISHQQLEETQYCEPALRAVSSSKRRIVKGFVAGALNEATSSSRTPCRRSKPPSRLI